MAGPLNATLTPARYIRRETLVSAAINGAISVGFFLLVFAGVDPVPVWGVGNYASDFVPQSFMVGFMATLVPGLMCLRVIAAGRFPGIGAASTTGRSIVASAIFSGLAALAVGAGTWALLLWATGAEDIGNAAAFALKVAYGVALGALVTRLTLRRIFA